MGREGGRERIGLGGHRQLYGEGGEGEGRGIWLRGHNRQLYEEGGRE